MSDEKSNSWGQATTLMLRAKAYIIEMINHDLYSGVNVSGTYLS